MRLFLLNGKVPEACGDVMRWATALEKQRRVALTTVRDEPLTYVSTVFLGVDHRHFGDGLPILFETMVFGPVSESSYELHGKRRSYKYNVSLDDFSRRYCTWDEAVAGHAETVRAVTQYVERIEAEVKAAMQKAKK